MSACFTCGKPAIGRAFEGGEKEIVIDAYCTEHKDHGTCSKCGVYFKFESLVHIGSIFGPRRGHIVCDSCRPSFSGIK